MSERKEEIKKFFKNLSSKELEDYLQEEKFINMKEELQYFSSKFKNKKSIDNVHIELQEEHGKIIEKYYKLGEAYFFAIILYCINNKNYNIEQVKEVINTLVDTDKDTKNYVSNFMKDLDF